MKKNLTSTVIIIFLFLTLPFLILVAQRATQIFTRAFGKPAKIEVNTNVVLDPITPFWNSFAQGGEESTNMIAPLVSEIRALNPEYIRIDHIYDFYDVVQKEGGGLAYDFSRLDAVIDSILSTGAKPFIALSYMPSAIAKDGNITNPPNDWNEWTQVIQRTVQHYSGKSEKNITNVYYEVWNEPDLFGGWKVYGEKNYMTLYSNAITGANRATNVNPFKIGGPATTALYKNWINTLLKHASKNNLRLDFISWHRYSIDPKQFSKDLKQATNWTFAYPRFTTLPKLITEWGFDSDINPGYDSSFSAAHTVSTVKEVLFGFKHLFAFELIDGLDPSGKEYWGRWGLVTHPSKGKKTKLRHTAFTLLNKMKGSRLLVKGEGTWVTGFAAKDGNTTRLILSNYDPVGKHTETTPITFTNLSNGSYQYKQTMLPGDSITLIEEVQNGRVEKSIFMPKGSVLLIELIKQ